MEKEEFARLAESLDVSDDAFCRDDPLEMDPRPPLQVELPIKFPVDRAVGQRSDDDFDFNDNSDSDEVLALPWLVASLGARRLISWLVAIR